jgi:DNA repair protein RecN (Recombination protein N)
LRDASTASGEPCQQSFSHHENHRWITQLGEDERVEELARMLGGVEITKRTREHAAEMLRSGMRADKKAKRA